jgi:hypothetical protein
VRVHSCYPSCPTLLTTAVLLSRSRTRARVASEFATTRLAGVVSDSVSDGLSGVSASLSTSNSFNISSPLPLHARSRARLSPVSEGKITDVSPSSPSSSYPTDAARASEPGFDMVTPLHSHSRTSEHSHHLPSPGSGSGATPTKHPSRQHRRASHGTTGGSHSAATHATHASAPAAEEDLFARQKVPPLQVWRAGAKSALSSMMAASHTTNPFSDLYSAISGRGVSPAASMTATVFFPFAREPAGNPMALSVRRDATVEEVLGFALWSYWEAGWLPRLDEDPNAPEERLSAVGWVMKIAEDDGEVDEDFPSEPFFAEGRCTDQKLKPLPLLSSLAPNRELKISKINFHAYAVLEADPSQGPSQQLRNRFCIFFLLISLPVQQNKVMESKIQRSPSRVAKIKKSDASNSSLAPSSTVAPSANTSTSTSALAPSTLINAAFPGSYNSSGPQIFLRIRIQDTVDAAHLYTTISVYVTSSLPPSSFFSCEV